MRLPAFVVVLVTTLSTTACAGTRTSGAAPEGVPNDPVSWPSGRYTLSARVAAESGPARHVQAELRIFPDGAMEMITGLGACDELATDRAAARSFRCGDAGFGLVTDGRIIRGTASAPVTIPQRVTERRCTRWRTDEQGRRTCARWNEGTIDERTVQATGDVQVTRVG